MFRCNLLPALLAKWPGSFTCHCSNTVVERTPNESQYTKLTLEKKILPPLLPRFERATFRSRVRRTNQQAIPAPSQSGKSKSYNTHRVIKVAKIMCTQIFVTFSSGQRDLTPDRPQCENLSGNELTRNLLGNIHPQSSQPAKPFWTDPGIKSGISVRELIPTSKTTKKA